MKRVLRWVSKVFDFWRSLSRIRHFRQPSQVRSRLLQSSLLRSQPIPPCPPTGRQLSPTAFANPSFSTDYVICATPRAEIVETLNRTLKSVPANDRKISCQADYDYADHDYIDEDYIDEGGIDEGSHANPLRYANSLSVKDVEDDSDGKDYPDRVSLLLDLAYLVGCQGRQAEAERLYQQVITLRRQQFGDEHLEIAASLSELAALYRQQNRYSQVQPLLQQALAIRQRLLIGDHPHIAETLHQLADSFCHQQLYAQAESLYQQALTIFRKHFGAQHPCTQSVYSDLMQMIATAIESGQFDDLIPEPPPLDLNSLSKTYFWAQPSWERNQADRISPE
jgi:tetratricopeptide (TPR) repeat protein